MNNIVTWTWDQASAEFFWSPAMCAMFAHDPAQNRLTLAEAQRYYSPASWEHLLIAMKLCSEIGAAFDIECELRLADGRQKWIRQRGARSDLVTDEIAGTVADITMRKQASRRIEESGYDLLGLLDSLPVAIAYIDTEYRFLFINQTYLDWFALRSADILGLNIATVLGTETFEQSRPYLQHALLGENATYQTQIPVAALGVRHISVELLPVFSDEDAVQGCYFLAHDISQHKKNEEQLRINEARWQLALESSGDGVWDWYPQLGVEILSRRLKEIYGYADEEIPNLSDELDRRTHPDDLVQMQRDRQAHFDGLTPLYINEHRVQCKDGRWKWVLTRGTVIERDADGKPVRVVGTHTDISERKQSEVALRESEERLRMALSATNQGTYDLNVQTGVAVVSAEYAHILGYAPEDFHESNDAWLARLHPDDRISAEKAYNDYIAGRSKEYRLECRQRKRDGDWVWILSVGAIVERDQQGQPLRMLGTYLDITERKKSEALIWRQANIDMLTGLPNRPMLYGRLEQDIRKSRRSGLPLAILFIDLDHFKEVNDTLGHATGDALLIEAARRLRTCVRESDTVARLGGDEFTVSLPDQHDPRNVEIIAQHINEKMAAPFLLGNEEVFLSASIGITLYPHDADNLEDLLKHADQAMYAAKAGGRNRYSYFTPSMQTAALARMRLANDLRLALSERQLQVYFQPIVDLASGRIRKAEALVRWQHPQLGYVSPAEFIPVAEASSLILAVGEYVFHETLRWVRHWRDTYHPDFQISINQSPKEFQDDGARYSNWLQYLRDAGLPGQAIAMEITEGLLLDASDKVSDKLLQFRDAGIQVALDDFGTGYSSLSYLKKFDIDYLKIDQSFIRNLAPGSSDSALPEAIIMMAHKLGLKVIAEGVETAAQQEMLTQAGCDYAQGYLFARPLPPEQLEDLLRKEP